MNELIKITEENGKQAVSARDLHGFLGSKREFATWIKDRIKKYDLTENQDYVSFDEIVKRKEGVRGADVRIEYALSLDCAKELAMVEGNAKGKQARKYFIECERKLKENNKPSNLDFSDPETVLLLAQNWKDERQKRIAAESAAAKKDEIIEIQHETINELAPKADYTEKVLTSKDTFTATQLAKEFGFAAQTLNRKLKELKVQYKHGGQWLLYAKYQNKGYTKTNTYTEDIGDETRTWHSTVWTEKGRSFIHDLLTKKRAVVNS